MKKKILNVIGICFGVFCLICFIDGIVEGFTNKSNNNNDSKNNTNKSDYKNTESDKVQNPTTKPEFDIEISIKEMSEIYYNNELNGNKHFFGKKVKTQAKFEETSNGIFSGLIVYFKGIDSIYSIHCTSFDKETKGNISTFNRGETVNIIGTVDELVGSSINFKDCKIYK